MTIFQGLLLGVVQGVAEFLPISSSAHLLLAEHFLNVEFLPLAFSVFLHLATLLAVVIFFRKHIAELFFALGRIVFRKPILENYTGSTSLTKTDVCARSSVVAIFIITFVTGVIGVLAKKILPNVSLRMMCLGFIATSLLLITSHLAEKRFLKNAKTKMPGDGVSDKNGESGKNGERVDFFNGCAVSKTQSLIVGFAQGLAALPGLSRSGSTISASLFSGLPRVVAGELSFIASIPAVLGAFLLELKDLQDDSISFEVLPLVVSFFAAFVVGLFAISLFMKIIKSGKLFYFAFYLIPLGVIGFIFL